MEYGVKEIKEGRIALNVVGKNVEVSLIWRYGQDERRVDALGGEIMLYVGGVGGDKVKDCCSWKARFEFSVTKHIFAFPHIKRGLDMFCGLCLILRILLRY